PPLPSTRCRKLASAHNHLMGRMDKLVSVRPMKTLFCSLLLLSLALPLPGQAPTETVTIDANAPAHPFPHYWEQMFGSGRAILSLRDSYRRDLNAVHQITGFRYIRFHGI